jgi:tRNA threonylcarbamoyladenosine biosynthesis protein TsaB
MRLLAFEAATRRVSVALWIDGRVEEAVLDSMNGGSEWLLPAAKRLLADAGCSLADVDALACGRGPGAFTGLRLAAGCVQGLAFGLDRPAIGVCSLEALAAGSGESRVYACLDARMGEVYVAAYDGGVETIAPTVAPPAQVPVPAGGEWVGCGDGFAVMTSPVPGVVRVRQDLLPSAAFVARLAAARFADGERAKAADLLPLYVRDKVALTTAERLARGGVR